MCIVLSSQQFNYALNAQRATIYFGVMTKMEFWGGLVSWGPKNTDARTIASRASSNIRALLGFVDGLLESRRALRRIQMTYIPSDDQIENYQA